VGKGKPIRKKKRVVAGEKGIRVKDYFEVWGKAEKRAAEKKMNDS